MASSLAYTTFPMAVSFAGDLRDRALPRSISFVSGVFLGETEPFSSEEINPDSRRLCQAKIGKWSLSDV